ncbi:MAG: hypothetical protein COS76_00775 [Candidatus Portnoybacteria bacterium CG06_land_8_20_14_3_00_39_12]|uniref:PDZ domain-containing protein n=3 Tax=Candidatus Portnoyibacteriota TaxID=1817913 RepID=A0A2M8KGQ5_9BACT|nr:MAG: hypothetical protein AUJ33_02060 [Parcubacteria group bacterium CG1_02_40_25]PIU75430.1 MAG: hypothetical protein COS76_00775 [Candidatus Portnoybacteria bacterium CG06_land_8_20_14_3_00_39_12]PIZ70926.1 MAG: hypothetical protein COY09_01875 [Candidatus Portnoybacteria bacterium CG_4_10_14_0_2_um_filter_39_11]PJE59102.1 MAG: hypothetical protein COU83_00450 [Candidatus Portnoybacteria bacterium CG10_big_fil_rev_8_21_14_0_10_40_22]
MDLSKKLLIKLISINALIALFVGFVGGVLAYDYVRPWVMNQRGASATANQLSANGQSQTLSLVNPETTQEAAVMAVVKNTSPSVVSIFIYKNMPVYSNSIDPWNFFQPFQQKQQGTERQEIGGGTGFVISKNLIATNKHVASDASAEYEVVTNDGQKYNAQILAQDPFNDLAILRVENLNLPILNLGDSDNLQIGQSVVAIGNALGEFRNTVSVGVISGLSRSLQAGAGLGGAQETLEELVQTDAAINSGNSGGPLLNLKGEVVGINVAKASGADNIGFALPINKAKKVINDVIKNGKISYPFLGVRFLAINAAIKQANNLPFDYGALIVRGQGAGEVAIAPGSAADKAGLQENDIILEINGTKIDVDNTLPKLLQKYPPGQTITLKIWHQGAEKTVSATLGEQSSS